MRSMRKKRSKKSLPIRKIAFFAIGFFLGGVAIYLFFVGLFSILSFAPIINQEADFEIVESVSLNASVPSLEKLGEEKNIRFDSIRESSNSAVIIAKIKEGPDVYFSSAKDAKFQMDSLQIILSKLTIDNKEPKLIDMRYTRPIVKF